MTVRLTLLPHVAFDGAPITSPGIARLLAVLADDPGVSASGAKLVEELWPLDPPEHPAKALQVLVSRARTATAAEAIAHSAGGYRLALATDQVDVTELRQRALAARRADDAGAALTHADAGLALWPEANAADPARDDPLERLRAEAVPVLAQLNRSRALALAALGRDEEARELLTPLVEASPHDEPLLAALLRSEARTVSVTAALARFEAYRRQLRDTAGTDPGPTLGQVQQELLAGEQPAVRAGVEHEPNALLGRADDLRAVLSSIAASRVTSIVGVGGLGKTRLAHAVSARASQRKVHFIPLAAVTASAGVAPEVAAALGVTSRRVTARHSEVPLDLVASIAESLRGGAALLVLDNCEHVLQGVTELVRDLVAQVPDLHVLTTTRAPLDLSSESVYLLPQLDPATGAELFVRRARAARPDVELPPDAIRRLCVHLDGLPLALELAAARTGVLSVEQIEQRLGDRFALLTRGARDAPDRHRTLQAVIDWSWQLLGPVERRALRRLGVFADGFDLAAAAAVLGTDHDPIDSVESLVTQSLLQREDRDGRPRFRMLETVREFADDKLREAAEHANADAAMRAWAVGIGTDCAAAVLGPAPESHLRTLRAEEDNLVAAHRSALAEGDQRTIAGTYAALAALWTVESRHERVLDGVAATLHALSHYRPAPDLVETTRVALVLGTLTATIIGNPAAARGIVALRRLPPSDEPGLFEAYATLLLQSRPATLDPGWFARVADTPDPALACSALLALSHIQENDGDPRAALATHERIAEVRPRVPSVWLASMVQVRFAELLAGCGRYDEAAEAARSALPLVARFGATDDLANLHWQLAVLDLHLGAVPQAREELQAAAALGMDDLAGKHTLSLLTQAEVELAEGNADAGLATFRHAIDAADEQARVFAFNDSGRAAPWLLVTLGQALVAHLAQGRLHEAPDLADRVRRGLHSVMARHAVAPLLAVDLPICGVAAIALSRLLSQHPASARQLTLAARGIAIADALGTSLASPTIVGARAAVLDATADLSAFQDARREYDGADRARRFAALADWLEDVDRCEAPVPT